MNPALRLLQSSDFSRAVIMGVAVTVPLLIGIRAEQIAVGVAICFGAFWSFPSNVRGSFRNKAYGVLIATALITLVTLLVGLLNVGLWVVIPLLGILAFGIAYLAVYGFRASLISFSGLLALVLNFAETSGDLAVYEKALLVAAGGLWYLLLITLWHLIHPREHTRELFVQAIELTADLLRLRAALIDPAADQRSLQNDLLKLQAQLVDNHETLRSTLIPRGRQRSDMPIEDKNFSVFILLVELLETAVTNPVDFTKMNTIWQKHPALIRPFQELITGMASQLATLSTFFSPISGSINIAPPKLLRQNLQADIDHWKTTIQGGNATAETILIVQNFFNYQQRQSEKIGKLQSLLQNTSKVIPEGISRTTAQRFLSQPNFSLQLLFEHFTFRSEAFRHALRLALAMMVGYSLGNLLQVQNPYWILLTIIVIIRPSYGLTRDRFKQRIIGTLIGAAVAAIILLLTNQPYLYGGVAIISLVIAFTRLQSNYRTAATFITISIITIYAIIEPDVISVIQYRIIDTLIGATISLAAVSWLWPYWGYRGVRKQIRNSIIANLRFLREITEHYTGPQQALPISYSLARKNAFTEVAKLSNAYQEISREPASQQKQIDEIYEFVVLNHTFLSALSSFSTYVKNRPLGQLPNLPPSLAMIHQYLEHTLQLLHKQPKSNDSEMVLSQQPAAAKNEPVQPAPEAYLIGEQLAWMERLALRMEAVAMSMKRR